LFCVARAVLRAQRGDEEVAPGVGGLAVEPGAAHLEGDAPLAQPPGEERRRGALGVLPYENGLHRTTSTFIAVVGHASSASRAFSSSEISASGLQRSTSSSPRVKISGAILAHSPQLWHRSRSTSTS